MSAPVPLLLTRPEAGSARFLERLRARHLDGFVPVVSPLISIVHRPHLPEIPPDTLLVFTSAHAVQAYAGAGGPPGAHAFAVGDATAAAARDAGLEPVSAGGTVETLLTHLLAKRPDKPILHLRGRVTRGDLVGRLRAEGLTAGAAIVYDQPACPLSTEARAALDATAPVIAPVFSPRTARLLARAAPIRAPLLVAAMSNRVADALEPLAPLRMHVAEAPDAAAMADAVAALLQEAAMLEAGGGAE
ncbi:uroporphyrinogen-III synthase [Roseivivax jejudonensis]|uniref:Uroporphyrinogen-III synthase n=1 Tax=Roseivivax jejudonensis TaxID=1529041 RepID=A0A1X6YLG6_9RHOB|nr:uroporphyrinogen-III synthase [Roseivivax jejudonensis]SLN24741.1 uroporphyrinogen-III synthase [Roseivivax jejudonensis]